jgi:predicted transcriptional regulator
MTLSPLDACVVKDLDGREVTLTGNAKRVYETLREQYGTIYDIADYLQIHKKTADQVVAFLVRRGLVLNLGPALSLNAYGGRPRTLYATIETHRDVALQRHAVKQERETWILAERKPRPEELEVGTHLLSGGRRSVYEALVAGHQTIAELTKASGLSKLQTYKVVRRLIGDGLAEQVGARPYDGRGAPAHLYRAVTPPTSQSSAPAA